MEGPLAHQASMQGEKWDEKLNIVKQEKIALSLSVDPRLGLQWMMSSDGIHH